MFDESLVNLAMTLKLIWWGIFGFLIIAFAITSGTDIGVNFLIPFIGHNEDERSLILDTIGPTWAGNQVWLITLVAGLFAIWPMAFATIFSSMYLAFLLVLIMLILRPPGIDYRSKINSHAWHTILDGAVFLNGVFLALSLGIVIGNLFTGLPFRFDANMHEIYRGTFITLLSPCSIIFALANLCMMGTQGAIFLQYKLRGKLAERAKIMANVLGASFAVFAIYAGIYVALLIPGYEIVKIPDLNANITVTSKIVKPLLSGWAQNYAAHRILWLFPILGLVTLRVAIRQCNQNRPIVGLFMHSITIAAAATTVGCALFPFIIPSKSNPNHSLTIWDAYSSKFTVGWYLCAVIILLAIISLYTAWLYRVMRTKVKLIKEPH